MKRNLFLLGRVFIMTLGISLGLSSCNSNDNSDPEIVTDEEAYYIAGEVLNDGKPLDGVKVSTTSVEATTSTNGAFELELSEKGDYSVTFSKDGYVPVTVPVTIKSDAKNKSSVLIKQELSKKSSSVIVTPDKDINISDEERGINLFIPAGSVDKNTNITMTPFTPGAKKITTGVISASLIALYIEPDGLVFGKTSVLTLKNPMVQEVRFGNMKHLTETNGTEQELDDITYDGENHRYQTTFTKTGRHILAVNVNAIVGGIGTEALTSKAINNLGNTSAITESVTIAQKYGWEISGDIESALKSKYPLLTDVALKALATSIKTMLSSMIGSAPGTGELDLTITFNISGDTTLAVEFLAQTETDTFTFPLVLEDGSQEWLDVSVKRYTGTLVNTVYQNGTDHSGGSGS